MKLIVPMLIVISTVFIVFISVWRIGAVNIEKETIENEIQNASSYWIENYYAEIDTLVELFFDSQYSGDDYSHRFTSLYSGVLEFWNEFSLAPELLEGVILVEETPEGRNNLYLDVPHQRLLYGYPESMEQYFEYARNIQMNNSFMMTNFPVYLGPQEMSRPFIYIKGNNRECLFLLDYNNWRYSLTEALYSAVSKKFPGGERLYSYRIEEGGQELAQRIIDSEDEQGFPLTLVSFKVDYLSEEVSDDYSLPAELRENDFLAYSISTRSRLLNNHNDLQQDFRFDDSSQVEVFGNSLWAVFEINKKAVLWSAVRIQLGAILLSYAALIFLILLIFILVRYNKKAARLVLDQQTFIANVSHELRTPLAVICNAGKNLEQGYVKEAGHIKKYGHMISDEGSRLSGMVESILLYSGFQLGQFSMEEIEVDELMNRILKPIKFLCDQKGLILEKTISPGLVITGDRNGINSAVMNLLRNAIIHGGSGGFISLKVGPSVENDFLEIIVEDSGPGIDRLEHKKIFQPFSRGAYAERLAVPGSGLGLSLVKKVASFHDGNVELRSAAGEGAVFILRLKMRYEDE